MTEEIRLDGLGLAPGVLETIVTLAARQVDGVAAVGAAGLAGLVAKGTGTGVKPVEVTLVDEDRLSVDIHIAVAYGIPLHDVARAVQESVADAVTSQVGVKIEAIDVFVDTVVFDS